MITSSAVDHNLNTHAMPKPKWICIVSTSVMGNDYQRLIPNYSDRYAASHFLFSLTFATCLYNSHFPGDIVAYFWKQSNWFKVNPL